MPYVQRDADGRLSALLRNPTDEAAEFLPEDHPDVQAFVGRRAGEGFSRLDADFVRVLEDLIDTLIHRHVINLTDLPGEAQAKLLARKSFRERSHQQALQLFGNEPIDHLVPDATRGP